MSEEYKDFVGFYNDVYPPDYCSFLIKEFERASNDGVGYTRLEGEGAPAHRKQDYSLSFSTHSPDLLFFNNKHPVDIFFKGLQSCFEKYSQKYSILQDGNIRCNNLKLQRTGPGEGYHVWHCENLNVNLSHRVMTYILYLNDLEDINDGGETEFLYQKQRVKPKENLMLIWPASYTHAHRGNPVLSEKYKYIVTGWFFLH